MKPVDSDRKKGMIEDVIEWLDEKIEEEKEELDNGQPLSQG